MQRLSQQQRLLLKLSPQQIMLMKLLQIPTAQLEERIKEEIEENPALEENSEQDTADDDIFNEDKNDSDDNDDYIDDKKSDDEFEDLNLNDYIKDGDDNDADFNFQDDGYGREDNTSDKHTVRVENSSVDELMGQLHLLDLSEHHQKIAEQVIGSIDDDGYLRREVNAIVDDLSFRQNVETSDLEVLQIIKMVQGLEPAGIGARNLKECLTLQLKRKLLTPNVALAIKVVDKYFDEITKKHYTKIQRYLNIDDAQFKTIIHIITHLNPRPGGTFDKVNKGETYIIPDFFIYNINGELELSLNSRNAPELRLSSGYRDMLRDYEKKTVKDPKQKDAVTFIKQKLDSAKWFIDAIKQRQNTLMLCMDTILKYQEAFFTSGDDTNLRPMILKDIANRTGLDISTVSRVANSKYVQTEFGTFSLKYFFSESLTNEKGEDVSTKEVKAILQEIINAEDKKKPISDDVLSELLSGKGYNIARRTITKYREQLNIPVARLRKQL
jgi:RNA polymerase sigma-54 factor